MPERFKILFKKESPKTEWRAVCPVQVVAFQAIRDRYTAESFLQIKLRNIACSSIEAVYLEAIVCFEDGVEDAISLKYLDADIPVGKEWQPHPVPLRLPEVEFVSVRVAKCKMNDGFVWKESDGFAVDQEPLILSEKAAAERRREIRDLGLNPADMVLKAIQGRGYWLCSCGQPNIRHDVCANCNLSKWFVFAIQDEGLLEGRYDDRFAKEENRSRVKSLISKLVAIVAALVVFAGIISSIATSEQAMIKQAGEQLDFVEYLFTSDPETIRSDYPNAEDSGYAVCIDARVYGTDGYYELHRESDGRLSKVAFRWEDDDPLGDREIDRVIEGISGALGEDPYRHVHEYERWDSFVTYEWTTVDGMEIEFMPLGTIWFTYPLA